uniref:Cysteine-rich receptor-like protein kinase 25 n=1 Tax=Cicer arietinum TaxID=3827 RepID=A0A3Q7XTP4_CICAR|nr:cysteine-rich receptor-like protein kinase 25 [Cicer arietinum]
MNQTANEAASHKNKKFATNETLIFGSQNLYTLAQCTPDLSSNDCRSCLNKVIRELPCCDGNLGGRIIYPSCNVRYELYPFYRTTNSDALFPRTNHSKQDSGFTQDPFYLSHNCSSNYHYLPQVNYFQIYLKPLFFSLSSNAANGNIFYEDHVEYLVYGQFMCRGDLPPRLCVQCLKNATDRLSSNSTCRSSPKGIIV